jgi:hypothetical protein
MIDRGGQLDANLRGAEASFRKAVYQEEPGATLASLKGRTLDILKAVCAVGDNLPRSRCPACSAMIRQEEIDLSAPFRCPSCDQSLRVSSFYVRRIAAASFVLAGLITYGLGARGPILGLAMWLVVLLIHRFLKSLAAKFEPPKLLLSNDYSLNLNSRIGGGSRKSETERHVGRNSQRKGLL